MSVDSLPNLDHILDELHVITTQEWLTSFHASYLWKWGVIPKLYAKMRDLSAEEKKTYAQSVQVLASQVEQAFFAHQDSVKQAIWDEKLRLDDIDNGMPWVRSVRWWLWLQTQLRRRVEELFQSLWFVIEYGHHVVTQFENFTSVNIPMSHPATEMHDTLYVDLKDEYWNPKLLRTHTSAHQNELIKTYWTPCRIVVPSVVYRNEKLDSSHDSMFYQIEWVVIEKNASIATFKHLIKQILQWLLDTDSIEIRMRPGYFPFVEPGFEIDWLRKSSGKSWGKEKRLELLGAWMIHPEVLRQAWLDPEEHTGFAFWIGLTRLVALREWLSDIRILTNWSLRTVQDAQRV